MSSPVPPLQWQTPPVSRFADQRGRTERQTYHTKRFRRQIPSSKKRVANSTICLCREAILFPSFFLASKKAGATLPSTGVAGGISELANYTQLSIRRSRQRMSSLEDFQANLELLPKILQRKYALLRDLDKSLQEVQRQNEQRCEQEIEEIKRGIKSGSVAPEASNIKFSDEAIDEQKHAIRIADEKVALAVQAYDLVQKMAFHIPPLPK
ncbi:hypothetical protein NMG60_11017599 [Bertholletia excelsa]